MEQINSNIQTEFKDGVLTIVINAKGGGEISKSGKSMVLASTHGNVTIPGGKGAKLGLNLYVPS
jgi:hypothetical protein